VVALARTVACFLLLATATAWAAPERKPRRAPAAESHERAEARRHYARGVELAGLRGARLLAAARPLGAADLALSLGFGIGLPFARDQRIGQGAPSVQELDVELSGVLDVRL
jgi:hypothetical protein